MSQVAKQHFDPASTLIQQQLGDNELPAILALDETTSVYSLGQPTTHPQLSLVSNRVDLVNQARSLGWPAMLLDYQLASAQAKPALIIHRVSKHKALVHYLINQAAQLLPAGGELWLVGSKGEGIKTYAKKALACFGSSSVVVKGEAGMQLFRISHRGQFAELLNDDNYPALRQVMHSPEEAYFSKPGVYGWQKIDAGSQLLAMTMGDILFQVQRRLGRRLQVLDLGCGYGYLSTQVNRQVAADITATDNNIAAIAACQQNFQFHNITGEVVADDAGAGIHTRFDIVVCNPPFHDGFDISGDLTDKFLASAAKRLRKKGKAIFVVNQFIALPKKSARYFQSCSELAAASGFRVYLLER